MWAVRRRFTLGIGAIVVGIPLMVWWNFTRCDREYFSRETMASSEQLLAEFKAGSTVDA